MNDFRGPTIKSLLAAAIKTVFLTNGLLSDEAHLCFSTAFTLLRLSVLLFVFEAAEF